MVKNSDASVFSKQKYRFEKYRELLNMSLDLKINHALKRIREFYNFADGKIFVSFSGGKDSTVLLHLVRSLYPDALAVFSDTTNEHKEIYDFVKSVDNVLWLNPKKSFADFLKTDGFPLVSKQVSRSVYDLKNPTKSNEASRKLYLTGIKRDGTVSKTFKLSKKWTYLVDEPYSVSYKCCDILKKKPIEKFMKDSGLLPFIGTTIFESSMRRVSWIQNGCNNLDSKKPTSSPISLFTEQDIWDYINRFNLNYSKIYDDFVSPEGVLVRGESRTGCAFCSFGSIFDDVDQNRFYRLKIRTPKRFEKIMNIQNSGVSYRSALLRMGLKI